MLDIRRKCFICWLQQLKHNKTTSLNQINYVFCSSKKKSSFPPESPQSRGNIFLFGRGQMKNKTPGFAEGGRELALHRIHISFPNKEGDPTPTPPLPRFHFLLSNKISDDPGWSLVNGYHLHSSTPPNHHSIHHPSPISSSYRAAQRERP